MCKALNELPTELGIEAVDKFSMSNLDNVRSKTGFMVNISFVESPMELLASDLTCLCFSKQLCYIFLSSSLSFLPAHEHW